MSQPYGGSYTPPRPDGASMSGALPHAPSPLPPPGPEAQMFGPAAYEDRPQSQFQSQSQSQSQYQPQPQPSYSPYTGTDAFRPQRASPTLLPPHEMTAHAAHPAPATPMLSTTPASNLKGSRAESYAAVREFADLMKRRQAAPPSSSISADIDAKIRVQGAVVLDDLRYLRRELREAMKGKEGHRWRKWVIGGAVASFIPAVTAIFRHFVPPSADVTHASNDTEYAFRRSQSLISRIRESVLGRGGLLAGFTFFVFSVLYVFQNEVALRVARTLSKRVKKLASKIEKGGGYEVDEADLKTLEGWRWRVLLW